MNNPGRMAAWALLSFVWGLAFLFAWKNGDGDADFDVAMAIGGFLASYLFFRRMRKLR